MAQSKLKILQEVQNVLNMGDKELEMLPNVIKSLIAEATIPPASLTLVFNPLTGQIKQVTVSETRPSAQRYMMIARILLQLSQRFNELAVEVKDVGKEEGVGGAEGPRGDDEPRAGAGSDRHEVGEMAPSGTNSSDFSK